MSVIKVDSCQAEHGGRPGLAASCHMLRAMVLGALGEDPRLVLEAPGGETHCKVAEWQL